MLKKSEYRLRPIFGARRAFSTADPRACRPCMIQRAELQIDLHRDLVFIDAAVCSRADFADLRVATFSTYPANRRYEQPPDPLFCWLKSFILWAIGLSRYLQAAGSVPAPRGE